MLSSRSFCIDQNLFDMPEAFCPIPPLNSAGFEPFLDTHDLRLEVPYGDDYLASPADGEYD